MSNLMTSEILKDRLFTKKIGEKQRIAWTVTIERSGIFVWRGECGDVMDYRNAEWLWLPVKIFYEFQKNLAIEFCLLEALKEEARE